MFCCQRIPLIVAKSGVGYGKTVAAKEYARYGSTFDTAFSVLQCDTGLSRRIDRGEQVKLTLSVAHAIVKLSGCSRSVSIPWLSRSPICVQPANEIC